MTSIVLHSEMSKVLHETCRNSDYVEIWTLYCCYLGYRYLEFRAKKKKSLQKEKKITN